MRRTLLWALAVAVLGGCRASSPIAGKPAAPAAPPERGAAVVFAQPPPIPADANALVTFSEAVAAPEDDIPAYAKVFIDGKLVGQTAIGPKSAPKAWGQVLEPGNHLFRFEAWLLPLPGEWAPLSVQWQPPERFIRVEPGRRTLVSLKLFDGGRRHSLEITRQPQAAP